MKRALALALATLGCTAPCRDNTLLVTLTPDDATAQATQLDVAVTLVVGQTTHKLIPYSAGKAGGTIEVDFAQPPYYRAGMTLALTITALAGSRAIGSGTKMVQLARGCTGTTLALQGLALAVLAGAPGGDADTDGTGSDARLDEPAGVALAGSTLYVVGRHGFLRAVDTTSGAVTTVPLVDALDGSPASVSAAQMVYDGSGALYMAFPDDHSIRKVDLASGKLSVVSGMPGYAGSSDSPPSYNGPYGLALDGAGSLYVADHDNAAIRRIALGDGTVTTIAGLAGDTAHVVRDGSGNSGASVGTARFSYPSALAFVGGDLYVNDAGPLRRIVLGDPPQVTTLASGHCSGGLVSDGSGGFYVTGADCNAVFHAQPPSAQLTLVAGMSGVAGNSDGVGPAARFLAPRYLAADGALGLFVSDGSTIRQLRLPDLGVTTLAGLSANAGSSDAPARFTSPTGLAFDGSHTLLVADAGNSLVRKIDLASGATSTFAGSGTSDTVDGQGTTASFGSPLGLAFDSAGNLYVSNLLMHCIRQISPAGVVKTIAGTPKTSGPVSEGPGAGVSFNGPEGLAFDGGHTLFVADAGNYEVRAIDLASAAFTVSNVASVPEPNGLAFDAANRRLFVAGAADHVIRAVALGSSSPAVTVFAGLTDTPGYVDADVTAARFFQPGGLALDGKGSGLYVADGGNDVVRRIDFAQRTVSTVIGSAGVARTRPGMLPGFVDAPAFLAVTPRGLAVTSSNENSILIAPSLD